MLDSILHIGFPQPGLERVFQGAERYVHIKWQGLPHNILHDKIVTACKEIQPKLVFIQVQTANIILPNTIQEIRNNSNAFICNWSGDVRAPLPKWYIDLGRIIDLTCFSNTTDVDTAVAAGINAKFLNIGFDDKVYCPGEKEKGWPEIVFMGNNYRNVFPLSGFRAEMVNRLSSVYQKRFRVYGNGWVNTKHLSESEETSCYRSCKIAINLSHFDYGRYSSDRLLRIMASGAFCLSHNYKDIEQDFIPGEDLDVWNTLDELILKINHYLDKDTSIIARTGCKKVFTNHTWQNRINQLINDNWSTGLLA